jgi:hypothetical protein
VGATRKNQPEMGNAPSLEDDEPAEDDIIRANRVSLKDNLQKFQRHETGFSTFVCVLFPPSNYIWFAGYKFA